MLIPPLSTLSLHEIYQLFLFELAIVEIALFYMLLFILYRTIEDVFYLKRDNQYRSMVNRFFLFISILIYFVHKAKQDDVFIVLPLVIIILVFLYLTTFFFRYVESAVRVHPDYYREPADDSTFGFTVGDYGLDMIQRADLAQSGKEVMVLDQNNIRTDILLYFLIVLILVETHLGFRYVPLYLLLAFFFKNHLLDIYLFDFRHKMPKLFLYLNKIDAGLISRDRMSRNERGDT